MDSPNSVHPLRPTQATPSSNLHSRDHSIDSFTGQKMSYSRETTPLQSSPREAASPRLFWQNRNANAENFLRGSLSPNPRRSSLERLQKASRVRNSNILALEQKQEYDPTRVPQVERPLAKVQENAFAGHNLRQESSPLEKNTPPNHHHQRSRSKTDIPLYSHHKSTSSPSLPVLPSQQTHGSSAEKRGSVSSDVASGKYSSTSSSPIKSSLSSSRFKSTFNEETGEWVLEPDASPFHGLRRHAKSVTFDAAPPQINEYEMATPDASLISMDDDQPAHAHNDHEDDYDHDDFYRPNTDDSFDAALEDVNKTPVVDPYDDWRHHTNHRSSLNGNSSAPYDINSLPDGALMPSSPPQSLPSRPSSRHQKSESLHSDHRPLPPLPSDEDQDNENDDDDTAEPPSSPPSLHAHSRTNSQPHSPTATSATSPSIMEKMYQANQNRRSLPPTPLSPTTAPSATNATRSEIQNLGSAKMPLEDRLRIMLQSTDARASHEQQRERRLRRGMGRDRLDTSGMDMSSDTLLHSGLMTDKFSGNTSANNSMTNKTRERAQSMLQKEVEMDPTLEANTGDDTLGELSEFQLPPKISRESILRRVNADSVNRRESEYQFSSPASSPERALPLREQQTRHPDVPIPSTETHEEVDSESDPEVSVLDEDDDDEEEEVEEESILRDRNASSTPTPTPIHLHSRNIASSSPLVSSTAATSPNSLTQHNFPKLAPPPSHSLRHQKSFARDESDSDSGTEEGEEFTEEVDEEDRELQDYKQSLRQQAQKQAQASSVSASQNKYSLSSSASHTGPSHPQLDSSVDESGTYYSDEEGSYYTDSYLEGSRFDQSEIDEGSVIVRPKLNQRHSIFDDSEMTASFDGDESRDFRVRDRVVSHDHDDSYFTDENTHSYGPPEDEEDLVDEEEEEGESYLTDPETVRRSVSDTMVDADGKPISPVPSLGLEDSDSTGTSRSSKLALNAPLLPVPPSLQALHDDRKSAAGLAPSTPPAQILSKPEYDGTGWGDPEEYGSCSPDSVIHNPTHDDIFHSARDGVHQKSPTKSAAAAAAPSAGQLQHDDDLSSEEDSRYDDESDVSVSYLEESEYLEVSHRRERTIPPPKPPVVPDAVATIKASSGSKLKTRVSATPSDISAMREARRIVSREVPAVPRIPSQHLKATRHHDIENDNTDDYTDDTQDSYDDTISISDFDPAKKKSSAESSGPEDAAQGSAVSTDAYLQRHPSFKKRSLVLDLDLGLSLDKDFDRVIESQKRGYLMRQNTKVISASDKESDAWRSKSAGNSPVKAENRPQSWTVEPWSRQKSNRKSRGPSSTGPAPPLPGQESNATPAGALVTVNEDELMDLTVTEAGERGRLFVKVMGVKDLDLPLPKNERTWFSLTLDNGVHCVTTAWLELARTAPIGQEFELVVPQDLEFQLTLNVKLEKPAAQQPKIQAPAFTKTHKHKTSTFSRVFASPKKRKEMEMRQREEEEYMMQQQLREAQAKQLAKVSTAWDLLSPLVADDGSFARSYVCLKEHEKHCYGRPYHVDVACFNEWAHEEANFASSVKSKRGTSAVVRRAPYKVGKLELQLLFVPRPKGSTDDDMPKSMNSCIREMKAAEERLARTFEGHLSQQGGDCPYWRRRYFKLAGTKLTAYHESTLQPRATINLGNARGVIDDKRTLTEREIEGKGGRRRRSAFAEDEEGYMFVEEGFRIKFNNGEVIDFYADTAADKEKWLQVLAEVIGRSGTSGDRYEDETAGPRRKWCELVLKREEASRKQQAAQGKLAQHGRAQSSVA